jgi:hypothetical protein
MALGVTAHEMTLVELSAVLAANSLQAEILLQLAAGFGLGGGPIDFENNGLKA